MATNIGEVRFPHASTCTSSTHTFSFNTGISCGFLMVYLYQPNITYPSLGAVDWAHGVVNIFVSGNISKDNKTYISALSSMISISGTTYTITMPDNIYVGSGTCTLTWYATTA
jgi:hypothetical protein